MPPLNLDLKLGVTTVKDMNMTKDNEEVSPAASKALANGALVNSVVHGIV